MNIQGKAIITSLVVIALALTAISGVTYSWFSDSEQSEINITTGNISLDVDITDIKVTSYGGTAKDVTTSGVETDLKGNVSYTTDSTDTTKVLKITFINAAPGDEITFYVAGSVTNTIDVFYTEGYTISASNNTAASNPFTVTGLTGVQNFYRSTSPNTISSHQVSILMDRDAGNDFQGVKYSMMLVFEAKQSNAPMEQTVTSQIQEGTNNIGTFNVSNNVSQASISFESNSPSIETLTVSTFDGIESKYTVVKSDGSSSTALAGIDVTSSNGISALDGTETAITFVLKGLPRDAIIEIYHGDAPFTGTVSKYYDDVTGDTIVTITTTEGFSTYSVLADVEAKIGDKFYKTLSDAIKEGGNIILLKDISTSTTFKIEKQVMIDGNGHEVKSTAGDAFYIYNGANGSKITNMTIKTIKTNGSIGSGRGLAFDQLSDFEFTCQNLIIDATQRGITITGNNNINVTLNVIDCMISALDYSSCEQFDYDVDVTTTGIKKSYENSRGISIWEFGSSGDNNSVVNIKGTTIQGFYYAVNISQNEGNDCGNNGLVVNLVDSTLKGRAAINNNASNSTINIESCHLTGINNLGGLYESFGFIVDNGICKNNEYNIKGCIFTTFMNDTGMHNDNATQYMIVDRGESSKFYIDEDWTGSPTEYINCYTSNNNDSAEGGLLERGTNTLKIYGGHFTGPSEENIQTKYNPSDYIDKDHYVVTISDVEGKITYSVVKKII